MPKVGKIWLWRKALEIGHSLACIALETMKMRQFSDKLDSVLSYASHM